MSQDLTEELLAIRKREIELMFEQIGIGPLTAEKESLSVEKAKLEAENKTLKLAIQTMRNELKHFKREKDGDAAQEDSSHKEDNRLHDRVDDDVNNKTLTDDHVRVGRPLKKRRLRVEVVIPPRHAARAHVNKNDISSVSKATSTGAVTQSNLGNVQPFSYRMSRRLLAAGDLHTYTIDLGPEILRQTADRFFMSRSFGGSLSTRPVSAMEYDHGYRGIVYINLLHQPHAPHEPGQPGLYISGAGPDDTQHWPSVHRMLVRLELGRWLYVGQYKLTEAPLLALTDWESQTIKVRRSWAHYFSSCSENSELLAHIRASRALNREPSERELEMEMSKGPHVVSTEDALNTWNKGHAMLKVWYMQCIGYDEAFQREIIERLASERSVKLEAVKKNSPE